MFRSIRQAKAVMLWPALLITAPLCAGNLSFLKDAPTASFDKTDIGLMKTAAREMLEEGDVGAVREWKNAETGHSGRIEVRKVFETTDGRRCKRLRVINRAKSEEAYVTQPLCRGPEGEWMRDESAEPRSSKTPPLESPDEVERRLA